MNLAKIPNCITITSLSLFAITITIIKMGRPPCCDKSNVKRGIWTAEEDAKILAYVSTYGVGNWTLVPKKAGLNRCGKSCRLRWTNYLRPDLKHDGFTPQEEDLIINLHKAIGSRWSLIAKQLPGRTDNDVKNYWNTKLRKKLAKMGIDPVTHKPFSQILSEYGNISGGLPSNNATRVVGSLNRGGSINSNSNSSMPISELTSLPTSTSPPMLDSLINTNNNNPWDFQAQFQVINQETMRSALFNEAVTPSSSSSSCSSYTVNQIINSPLPFSCQPSPFRVTPNSPFTWSDFLNGEPAISTDDMLKKQETLQYCKFTSEIGNCKLNGVEHENSCSFNYGPTGNIIGGETNSHSEASSSIAKSFVDALLDQDRQLRSEFPQLLNESFEY